MAKLPMTSPQELFSSGDRAEDAGDFALAFRCFQQGASLGDVTCLERLAHMYDEGVGVDVDKPYAMRCYQRAWRMGGHCAVNNIAILYREQGNLRAMVRWYKRAIARGDEDARVALAKCYLSGDGVRRSDSAASLQLRLAMKAYFITEASQDEAARLLRDIETNVGC